ncbi:MAG: ABC transporter permease [Halocynthiibacter sp.]
MFQAPKQKNSIFEAGSRTVWLIYHSTVRSIRNSHGNAIIGLVMSMMQSVIMIAVFYLMFSILGARSSGINGGSFLLYLMSGILLFTAHNGAISSVMGAPSPTSPQMLHAPLNTAIVITSSALSALYRQILALGTLLFVYHVQVEPLHILYPAGAAMMVLLAWLTGCVIGLIFYALRPWFPGFVKIASMLYMRANMITSGKMFLANTMPTFMVSMFAWNPLFHCIDQLRGFVFLNYTPRHTSAEYPFYFSLALVMLGLMGEFYTRKYASTSWNAKR